MAFDRSKFKAAKVDSYSIETKKAKKNNKSFSKGSGRAEYFKIEEGRNEFRLLPPHKEGEPPFRAIRTTMLKCEKDVWKDGEKTGKKEIKLSKIFIATQHSNKLKEDPVEYYIKTLTEKTYEECDKEEARKKLSPVYGYRDNQKKWHPGITPNSNYMFYALNEENKIGLIEMYDKITKQMENINIEYQNDDDPIGKDIFTDPDEGHPIIVKKVKESGKWNYQVDEAKLQKGQTWEEFFKEHRVSDEVLQALSEMPSLTEKYVDVYTTRDFDLAMDGLKRFDEEHGFNLFAEEDVLDHLEELYNQCPKEKESKTEDKPKEKSESKGLTVPQMKKFLNKYIKENYGEDYELPALKIPEVKAWYALASNGEDLPLEEPESGTDKENEPETEQENDDVMGDGEDDIDPEIQAEIEKLRKATQG